MNVTRKNFLNKIKLDLNSKSNISQYNNATVQLYKRNIHLRDFVLPFLLINYAYVKTCLNMYAFTIDYSYAKQDKKTEHYIGI